ncbi:glycosyltransferase family 4 protein [Bacillus sp. JJ1566]|uniref:glycosyltransferase family 4 protein n=1 Tax=Bacillus sp. JJ1566 TaxID=3122961 RepID=UPI002FFEB6DB
MKLLFVFSAASGGMVTLNYERDLALSRIGFECHFLYFRKDMNPDFHCDSKNFIMRTDEEIEKLMKEHKYSAIIVCTDYLFLERLNRLGYSGKVIYEIQGLGNYQTTVRWLEKAESYVTQYANAILYPNTSYLNELMKIHFPQTNKFSFHNCIDTNLFTYVDVPLPKKIIVGWVGRLDQNKNWIEFLNFGASLRKIFPNIQLWFFHDPTVVSKKEQIKFSAWVKKFNLTEDLIAYENIKRKNMAKNYSMIAKSGGFVCSTSQLEGFGYSVIEAMSCQCPVLTTRSGGVESFVIHNVTGKLYHQGNILEFLEEAKELIYNLDLREKIIKNANNLIQNSFNPILFGEHFMDMLRNLDIV